MQKENYAVQMRKTMAALPDGAKLLLHSCCGPCSSSVLQTLAQKFSITLLYYNPNIWPETEYIRRLGEQQALLQQLPLARPVTFVQASYNTQMFYAAAKGLEAQPEGGARCAACFTLRLTQAAQEAQKRGIGWFTTTLSVSPHKNAALLNQLGQQAAARHGLHYLPSDFKKEDGYRRSLALSRQYGLYRQDYCGCAFSYRQRYGGTPQSTK